MLTNAHPVVQRQSHYGLHRHDTILYKFLVSHMDQKTVDTEVMSVDATSLALVVERMDNDTEMKDDAVVDVKDECVDMEYDVTHMRRAITTVSTSPPKRVHAESGQSDVDDSDDDDSDCSIASGDSVTTKVRKHYRYGHGSTPSLTSLGCISRSRLQRCSVKWKTERDRIRVEMQIIAKGEDDARPSATILREIEYLKTQRVHLLPTNVERAEGIRTHRHFSSGRVNRVIHDQYEFPTPVIRSILRCRSPPTLDLKTWFSA
jgi:hypothetical protein